jgi:hypothetical protein
MGPAMLVNADEAAVAQVIGTHNQVLRWKSKYSDPEWSKLAVIIRGKQMPRRFHVATLCFAKLLRVVGDGLGYPAEGGRLVYFEAPSQGEISLDLLGTIMVDGEASVKHSSVIAFA